MFTVASLPRRVGAARQDLHAYNWFNQGSGESRIRQRTVDTYRTDLQTIKVSEKYILNYRREL